MSNDLFDLVYSHKKGKNNGFWGKFAYLNSYETDNYNNTALWNLQIAKLKAREGNQYSSFQHVNQFLNEILQVPIEQEMDQLQQMSVDAIYARIIQLLNAGFISSSLSPKAIHLNKQGGGYKQGSNKQTIQKDSEILLKELTELSSAINSSRTDGRVKRLAHALGGLGVRKRDLQDNFSSYKEYKANEAEVLMVEALNRHEGWRAVQSGQLFHNGQMLLEDAFVFDTTIDIDFGSPLKATVTNKKNKTSKDVHITKLSEFIAMVENINFSQSISLSDELYAKILEIRLFSAQAKSGMVLQNLLNNAAQRNALYLEEIGDIAILRDLFILYKSWYLDDTKESKCLAGMANYWLSKSILMTNLSRNEIYFTVDGFQTASQWMLLHKQMLKFNPSLLKVSDKFFNGLHPYAFTAVSQS